MDFMSNKKNICKDLPNPLHDLHDISIEEVHQLDIIC